MSADRYVTGIASEYFILSLLMRKGYEAYITSGNKKSIDIRVVHENKTFSIDVKAVQGYSSLIVDNVRAKHNHFIFFVIYNNKFTDTTVLPELYIVPSSEIEALTTSYGMHKRVMKGNLSKYLDNWQCLKYTE